MGCKIKKHDLRVRFKELAKAVIIDEEMDKETRVDVWGITPEDIATMVQEFSISPLVGSEKIMSKRVKNKIENNLNSIPSKFKAQVKAFVKRMQKTGITNDPLKAMRHQAIALKEVLDSIKGEVDKANRDGVEITLISPDGIIPYLPLHRLAASIGRKIMYTEGKRIKKGDSDAENKSMHVEHVYYVVGMTALQNLEDNGFLTLHDDINEGYPETIQDYLDDIDSKSPARNQTTTAAPAVELNLEALGIEQEKAKDGEEVTPHPALKHFTDRANAQIDGVVFGSYVKILKAINMLSQPEHVVFPETNQPVTKRFNLDDYKLGKTLEETRDELESHPVSIQSDLHDFFQMLFNELKNSDTSASKWLSSKIKDPIILNNLFNVEKDNIVLADQASFTGRNLSKTTPMDDLIEYFDRLSGDDPVPMYLALFGGRNARLVYDNTVINPHASKLMRHALAIDEYSMPVGSPQFNYLVDKIATALQPDPDSHQDMMDALTNVKQTGITTDLDKAIVWHAKFVDATSANAKLNAVTHLQAIYPGLDFASLIATVRAAKDVRESLDTGTLTSTFTVASDATASGAQLTLAQALGSNPVAIKLLLQQLGIFKGDENTQPIRDIYAILQSKLKLFFNKEQDDDGQYITETEELARTRTILEKVQNELFTGELRELSKGPTMTFIYNQSKSGANYSLSKEFTKRLLKKLDSKTVSDGVMSLINDLLGTTYENTNANVNILRDDSTLGKRLIAKFGESGGPDFLFDSLTEALTDKFLAQHKEMGDKIFKLINSNVNLKKMRVLPSGTVLDNVTGKGKVEYTVESLNEYGLTASKIFEVIHAIGNDKVLTREEKLQATILVVSFIHGVDTSNLYHALNGLLKKYNIGAVVVHDEVRSSPALLMDLEVNYIQNNYDAAYHFDIHEQVLLSAAVYDPSLKSNAEYTKLLKEVQENKTKKQELLEENYDFETRSVIGDKTDPSTVSVELPSEGSQQTEKQSGKTERSVKEVLQELAPDSELISELLESDTSSNTELGSEPAFNPQTDTITVSDTDTRSTGSNTVISKKDRIELIEHEIVHSYTSGIIADWMWKNSTNNQYSNLNLSYIQKTLKRVQKLVDEGKLELSPKAMERIEYALRQQGEDVQMSEFISIMSTETDVAAEVYKAVSNGKQLKGVIEKLVARVREIIQQITKKDLEDSSIDPEKLYSAINGVIAEGKSQRASNIEQFKALQTWFDAPLFAGDSNSRFVEDGWVSYLNESVARHVTDPSLRQSGRLLSATDAYMKVNYPAYRRVSRRARMIYDDSKTLQSLVHKITNGNINQLKKNEVLSLFSSISSNKEEIISLELQRFKAHTSKLSKAQKVAFFDFTNKMSMSDYFMYAEKVTDIDAEIATLESAFNDHDLSKLNSVVDFNVDDVITRDTKYNVHNAGFSRGKLGDKARKLVVLKSMKKLGMDRFNDLKAQTKFMDVLRDSVLAHTALIAQNESINNNKLRDNGIMDEYQRPVRFEAVTAKQFPHYAYGAESGWKVLRKPTANSPGIVYQEIIDSTYQAGVFTDIRLNSGDIDVDIRFRSMGGVLEVDGGYKLPLTHAEKELVGLNQSAEQALVRTMAHNLAIQDSEIIRDQLLEQDTYMDLTKVEPATLRDLIKDPERDHPWLLGAADDQSHDDLLPIIKAKYMPVPKAMSDVNGFDKKVKFVRKDIAYWLVGVSEESASNNPKIQLAIRILKDVIAGTKIGMVILNPIKILMDNVFNTMYLGVLGVDPLTMSREYRAVATEFGEYKELQNKLNSYRIRSYTQPKYQKRIEKLEAQLKAHPARGLVDRGFVNSLSSELIMNTDDPSSGFKSDLDTVLKKILQDDKGNNNVLGQFLMNASKFGVGIEDILETWSPVFGSVKSGKGLETEINRMAERIRLIKDEDDAVAYMHQYLNSPGSEFVKLGTHMTDLSDIMAKETYYRHLVRQGMDPKKAEIEVIIAFPDYKEGLPTTVKKLDSVGILMFPSYWLRMIQAMYRAGTDKPVSFGSEVAVAHYFEMSGLWQQTIISKIFSNWGLVHNPWNHIGWGSLFPTHVA